MFVVENFLWLWKTSSDEEKIINTTIGLLDPMDLRISVQGFISRTNLFTKKLVGLNMRK